MQAGGLLGLVPGLVLLSLGLASCGGAGEEFLPSAPGMTWQYRVVRVLADGEHVAKLQERSLGPVPCEAGNCFAITTGTGLTHVLRRVGRRGIERIARAETAAAVTPLPVPEWVIPDVDATLWRVPTQTVLLTRRNDDYEEARFSMQLAATLEYRVAEVGVAVSVPAGHFSDCLKLDGQARMDVARNRIGQTTHIKIDQQDWYCPGVGLVLRERTETTDNDFVANGRYRQELEVLAR